LLFCLVRETFRGRKQQLIFIISRRLAMATATDTDLRAQMAKDFRSMFAGQLAPELIDRTADYVTAMPAAAAAAYAANGAIASLIFWARCTCDVNGGKSFTGDAFGAAGLGGGALFGTVYTDDINRLYADTDNFALTATPVYTAFYFFDKDSNPLGSFQAGSVSTVVATGGGKGHWK
jgi:hypothetical protein